MKEELYTHLSAACSFPVAWGKLEENATLPRAILYQTSGVQQGLLQGGGLVTGRVQVDCYGETYAEAETAARQVRPALEHHSGNKIRGMFLQSERDTFDDDAALVHRVSLTYEITYQQ